MTSALAKSILPVSPQPEQSSWTHERRDELRWQGRLSMFESLGEQAAWIGFAESWRDKTSYPERPPAIFISSSGPRKRPPIWRQIDTDHITGINQDRLIFFHADLLTGLKLAAMFGRDVTARTDVQTKEDEEADSFVREEVGQILSVYAEYDFEPGFVSPLEQEFCDLIGSHGYKVISIMQGELRANRASTSALAEMVRVLGRIRNGSTVKSRYEVCVDALSHHFELKVRDAAALALCDLADPRAIPALREAADKESNTLVRTSHLEIADWLESLPTCQPSSEN